MHALSPVPRKPVTTHIIVGDGDASDNGTQDQSLLVAADSAQKKKKKKKQQQQQQQQQQKKKRTEKGSKGTNSDRSQRIVPGTVEDHFDGIHDIIGDRLEQRKLKPSALKRHTTRLTGSRPWNFRTYLDLFTDRRACITGTPIFVSSLLLACIADALGIPGRYNVVVILAMLLAKEFPFYPANSVRVQLLLVVCTVFSCGLDAVSTYISASTMDVVVLWILIALKFICIGFCVRNFQSAARVRKYMDRRLRLFFIPLRQPKRIMRDVRARLMALGGLHLVAVFIYAVQFVLLVVYFDYSARFLSPSRSEYALPLFLALKSASSFVVFLGVWYDTDIVLCLWYFGLLALWTPYVKRYIHKQKRKLGGWPLAFSFHLPRFYILVFVKFLDFLWGTYGWVLMGYTFGEKFATIQVAVRYFYAWVVVTLICTDVYCPLLFFGVRWLLRRYKIVQELKMLEVSDDSELDEFELRGSDGIRSDESDDDNSENSNDKGANNGGGGGDLEAGTQERKPLLRKKGGSKHAELRGSEAVSSTSRERDTGSSLLRSRTKPSQKVNAANSRRGVVAPSSVQLTLLKHPPYMPIDGLGEEYIEHKANDAHDESLDVLAHSSDEELEAKVDPAVLPQPSVRRQQSYRTTSVYSPWHTSRSSGRHSSAPHSRLTAWKAADVLDTPISVNLSRKESMLVGGGNDDDGEEEEGENSSPWR